MAIDHYENFPVASILLPAHLRGAVKNIYRFARTADDIADEGEASAQDRLHQLSAYRNALQEIAAGKLQTDHPASILRVFTPLAATIQQHGLPIQPFLNLLSAFEQDTDKTRYQNDNELLDYCQRSANPVGRLMLHLYQADQADNIVLSDAICSGLQLTNFWQDVAIDWQKNRVYIPQDALHAHGLDETYLALNTGRDTPLPNNVNWQNLMRSRVSHARALLLQGLPLCSRLRGRIGFELRLVVHGGLRILERLDELHYDVFFQRPTLRKSDWARLVWRALYLRSANPAQYTP